MLRITDFRVHIDDDTPLARLAAKRLKVSGDAIGEISIVRKALDARRKNNISFVYTLDVSVRSAEGLILSRLAGDQHVAVVSPPAAESLEYGLRPLTHRPVVVGFGPAGMMAALLLARHGYKPLVLERGRDLDRRAQDVAEFWRSGSLDPVSNVQFGEGGAGTFSDGKLTTRVTDPRMQEALAILVEAGAPPEIRYTYKPHIGTDKLRTVVKNIRQQIIACGGEVRFEAQVTDLYLPDGRLAGMMINGQEKFDSEILILAIGHSARDTYGMLSRRGMAMEAKAFAVGVRIEHPQDMIDRAQYGPSAGHPKLGPADYSLVYHDQASGRTAYSFCMCPGGQVVAAASEPGRMVTNGMSLHQRASGIANSALIVNVGPADFGSHVLDGIHFQQHYEQLAFQAGGGDYSAPAQSVGDLLSGRVPAKPQYLTQPTYLPGVRPVDLGVCLPSYICQTLAKALPDFGRKIKGFDHPQAVMTGVEMRSSAPVRIIRNKDYQSVNSTGVYPVGEGAGYAGGIMSAALDGMNAAAAIMAKYKPYNS
ncbi:NAD(P)/FAD-dependent oxidoreductase [Acetonema longum]|uniref:FAD dependent oxidoreductase n=1 Tax=Acetonema longum DSM 6540 TaxID=1009370 RepID=F7NF44_9FIRM|nr:hypothetical protein [Acetonema longum]EGO65299.1 FAD dependent oxidoreductase [Acetonema longum DSM 6540]